MRRARIRAGAILAGTIGLLSGCATNDKSLGLAREVAAAMEAYDARVGEKVAEQNRFYSERVRDLARASADIFPGRRDQLRATRAITAASDMAGAPTLHARRGDIVEFLQEVSARERELDRTARQQAIEAERAFRASLRALDARRAEIRRARRAVDILATPPRRRAEARALLRYIQELQKEIDREQR